MLANSFLKTDALTCFQTIYTVITAVHMHENVGAAGIPFDESEHLCNISRRQSAFSSPVARHKQFVCKPLVGAHL
jgi:hypothetical protein